MLYGFGVMHDVTREKATEKELLEIRELFEKTFDSQESAVIIMDAGTPPEIIRVNKTFSRVFLYPPETAIGRDTSFLHVDENTLREFQRQLYSSIEKQGAFKLPDFPMKRADGEIFPAEISVTPLENDDGKRIGWVSVISDIAEQKQAGDALRESERRYRTLFEKNRNPIAIIDSQGRYMDANPAFLEFTETSREQLLQMRVFEFAPPGQKAAQENNHRPAWETGGTVETEYYINGRIKILELTITPIQYQGTDAILGAGRDITEKKQAEKKLRAEHEKFVAAMNSLDAIVYAVDMRNYEIVFMNAYAMKKFGNGAGVKCYSFFYRGRNAPCEFCGNEKLFDDRGNPAAPYVYEFENEMDGEWYQCRAQAIQWPGGGFVRLHIATNITRRKKMENSLRESKRQLQEVCRLANIGVWDWDAGTDAVTWSEELYRIAGLDPALPAPSYADHHRFYTPNSWERLKYAINRSMTDGEPYEIELELVRPDGEHRWVNAFGGPVTGRDGEIRGLHGTVQDITERKRSEMEKTRIETQKQKLRKSESLTRMAGAIAHRFNNHLAVVIGNLEMALEAALDGGLSENLDESIKAAKQAAEVSAMMLTYLGQMSGKRTCFDLSDLCRHTLLKLKQDVPESVDIVQELPSPGPAVSANRHQVQQALTNLVLNAVEALTGNRKSIRVSVSEKTPEQIPKLNRFPVNWAPQYTIHACLEVMDTGKGIPETDIENLFDPFFSTQFTGRGLGLPVVLGVVQAHGGGITVESETGGGSVFRLFLPAVEQERPDRPDQAVSPKTIHEASESVKTGQSVLLVDDEEMIRNMAETMLKRLGLKVIKARGGHEAVEIFRKNREDIGLVICDLSMPDMNGWETLEALRKTDPDIPAILSSGYDEAHAMKGKNAEAPHAFLKKPYTRQELKNVLSRIPELRKWGVHFRG